MPYFKTSENIKLYYELHGNGEEKILFVTGLHTTLLTWNYQIPFFEELEDYQICILDNRGHGRSDKPIGIYSTQRMAKDIYELINDELKWKAFHLVGHSMGGMISLELALMDPYMIKSLCLYSTNSGRVLPPLYGLYLALGVPLASVQGKDKLAEAIVAIQFPPSYLNEKSQHNPEKTNKQIHCEDLLHEIEYGSGISHALGISGQLLAIAGHHIPKKRLLKLKSELTKQNVPILVITGTDDYLVDCKNSFYLSKVLNCELKVMKDAGHMLHQERPNEFNRVLLKHFRSTYIKSKL